MTVQDAYEIPLPIGPGFVSPFKFTACESPFKSRLVLTYLATGTGKLSITLRLCMRLDDRQADIAMFVITL